jgi:hypothetical protein
MSPSCEWSFSNLFAYYLFVTAYSSPNPFFEKREHKVFPLNFTKWIRNNTFYLDNLFLFYFERTTQFFKHKFYTP